MTTDPTRTPSSARQDSMEGEALPGRQERPDDPSPRDGGRPRVDLDAIETRRLLASPGVGALDAILDDHAALVEEVRRLRAEVRRLRAEADELVAQADAHAEAIARHLCGA